MTTKKYIAGIFTIFLLLATQFFPAAQQASAESEINNLLQQYNAVGLAVAVVKNNKLVYTHSFGLKNKEQSVPLEDKDLFRIASISKSFLATSIMQLVEAKKLSLDDDFSKLVGFTVRNPRYPDAVITLQMVLSHTSSINDSLGYFELDVINPSKNPGWAGCYSNYPPGKTYNYCNLNFNMAGAVIERITGQRYDQYVVNHILQPLKLYGGYCVDSLDQSLFATLYEYDAANKVFTPSPNAYNPRREELKTYTIGYSTPVLSPTGGMKISAADLARYMSMHMNLGKYRGTRIIKKSSARKMQSIIAEQSQYGLALLTTSKFIPGKILKGHTGSAYGLYSTMFFSPREKFGLVLITNGCNPVHKDGFNELLRSAAQVLYQNFIE